MDYRRQTPQALDAEHRASLALYGKLEQALVARDREGLARLAGPLARHLESEVSHHFDFEERELFPRMVEVGEDDLVALLEEEHVVVREVAATVRSLADKALTGSLDGTEWQSLRTHGLELCERLTSHAEKEEGALLPLLEDLLDDDADRDAFAAYAAG